ncbi:hypothetical protein HD597_007004 [Nonomuraea thailandensis]|uniref:Uncharacterized protein n=1 Tax=Nonomuraea thailandensis TaxID=1188745 RepID=A0A9X2GIZ7_9ACTN|nr:hypothetical protein [Nonomuraea thailandensis]MCP2359984.1 hypothetical protein [Nonomuraea thailandensis]
MTTITINRAGFDGGRLHQSRGGSDSTWRYVNVKGGPDRRFKNNARLPILLYGRLTLRSHSGLNLVWDASQVTLVHAVANALHQAITARPPVIHT